MRQTPLYDEHKALGCKIVDFSGWAMPVQYQGIVQEHLHTRKAVSLFDCSHMGEFTVVGAAAMEAFNRLVISDMSKIPVGRCRYGSFLNEDGGIIDDVITFRMAEDELFVVTNAGALERVSALITGAVDGAKDVSNETAKIDVQGPFARDIMERVGIEAAVALKYFRACRTEWKGHPLLVSRTGYTGELGYEIYMSNDAAVPLWRELLTFEETAPAGLGARDTLRTEVGYPLSGQDVKEDRTPLEANMEPFIAWDTEFVGKEALLRQKEAGGYQRLTAIKTADRRAPRHGFEVFDGDKTVGEVTSGTFGPSVGHGVGMGYLLEGYQKPGLALSAGPRRLAIETAEFPFYTEGTCRA